MGGGGGLEWFNLGIMSIWAVENKCRICVLKCIYYRVVYNNKCSSIALFDKQMFQLELFEYVVYDDICLFLIHVPRVDYNERVVRIPASDRRLRADSFPVVI